MRGKFVIVLLVLIGLINLFLYIDKEDEYVTFIQNPTTEQIDCLKNHDVEFRVIKEKNGSSTAYVRESNQDAAINCKQ